MPAMIGQSSQEYAENRSCRVFREYDTVIFGRRGRDDDDDDEDEEEEDIDLVLFQGAVNGKNPDLGAHAKLVQNALIPAKKLVTEALSRRAQMVRVDPKGKVAAVTLYVDGVPFPGERMPVPAASAITQMLKLLAGQDAAVRDKPQSGGIKSEYDEKKYEVRIDTQPVEGNAERLIIRWQEPGVKLETPKDLGFSDSLVAKIRQISQNKQGLILVAGMPLSGVTTATQAAVRAVDAYLYSVYCLAHLDREMSHIKTFEGNPGDTLEQTITRAKREDADVMYVDPITTPTEAKAILSAADNTAFFAEFQAADAADAIARLVKMAGDPQLVANNLKLVISQMLIRLLCRKCRHAFRPNPKLLVKIGLPPETKVLYRPPKPDEEEEDEEPEVCEQCGGTGYYGRTGLMEVIEITEGIQKVILAGGDAAAIRKQARAEKMQSFQSDGLRVAVEGRTSLEELQRAFKAAK